MGSVGDCYDNAMCESFFATLECELLDRRSFKTQIEARLAVFEFLEGWYNTRRRHSALGYLSPAEFERQAEPPTALRKTPPLPPDPHHPGRRSAELWKAASPALPAGTLPQLLENAARFPQPTGHDGDGREPQLEPSHPTY
jgi:hypothetical protein